MKTVIIILVPSDVLQVRHINVCGTFYLRVHFHKVIYISFK